MGSVHWDRSESMEYYIWLCIIGLVPGLCYSDLTSPGTAAENYFYYFPSAESANLSPSGLTPSADIDRTAVIISSVVSLPVVIATFILALLGSFMSSVLSFIFLERFLETVRKIVTPDVDSPDLDEGDIQGKEFTLRTQETIFQKYSRFLQPNVKENAL